MAPMLALGSLQQGEIEVVGLPLVGDQLHGKFVCQAKNRDSD